VYGLSDRDRGLGFNPGRWEPTSVGALSELGPETTPLARFKKHLNVYSGMKVHLDGRPAITHFSGNMSVLTGTTPRSNAVVLPTIDTLIADQIGATTRFKSLEMVSTGNPKHMYSFRTAGVFQPGEQSPAAMYARLFGPEFKDPNSSRFTPDPRVMARQSVLSAVKEQRQDLERALGAADRARLDEYFTSLRQLERQLAMQLEKPAPLEACAIPAAPSDRLAPTSMWSPPTTRSSVGLPRTPAHAAKRRWSTSRSATWPRRCD
jgi:hypothetical protein